MFCMDGIVVRNDIIRGFSLLFRLVHEVDDDPQFEAECMEALQIMARNKVRSTQEPCVLSLVGLILPLVGGCLLE